VTRISGRIDLVIVLGGCGIYLVALLAPVAVPPLVHLIAGAALVLFLPGHALLRGLDIVAADAMSRVLFAVAMSIVVTIVLGLVLEMVPLLRLNAADWRQMLAFVTGTLAALGLLRAPSTEALERPPARTGAIAWALLPVALVAASWVLNERSVAMVQQPAFTELWAVEGESDLVVLGIRNREGEARAYRLEVHPPLAGLESAWSVQLLDREAWERSISVPASARGGRTEMRLYRPEDEEPYRTVRLPSGSVGSARDRSD
jgi:uncharacterized membrane protein